MWVLGAIVGGLLFALGGIPSAIAGAVLGAGIGAVLGIVRERARAREQSERIEALEATIADLSARLAAVESAPARRDAAPPAADAVTTDAVAGASRVGDVFDTPSVEDAAARSSGEAFEPSSAEPGPIEPLPIEPLPIEPAAPDPVALDRVAPEPGATAPERERGRRRESFVAAALRKSASPSVRRSPGSNDASDRHADDRPDDVGRVRAFLAWLAGGNPVVRVGVIVLFLGVAFLLRYAYDRVHVPIELRLLGVTAGALVLLVLGFRLRTRRPDFALVSQGAGVGMLYLTVFGALRVWSLLPPAAAFAMLVAIAAFSAVLAVAQNALVLAIMGIAGGFLAPVLASTGQGSHVMLFSYYAILNAAILGIAWMRSWRPLNLLGFVFTFVIGTLWGVDRYLPELFATTEPFLVLFFLFYVALPILHARQRRITHRDYVDATLVFGTPVIAFGLQAALVQHIELGTAISALVAGLFYVALAMALWRRVGEGGRLLTESFLALGIAFGTLAIPLALDARWTSAAWALEGAALVWMGTRQHRLLPRLAGTLLQVAAGVSLFLHAAFRHDASSLGVDPFATGGVLLALAAAFSAWWLRRHAERLRAFEQWLPSTLMVWCFGWLTLAGLHVIHEHLHDTRRGAWLLLVAALVTLGRFLARRWSWAFLRNLACAGFPATLVVLFDQLDGGGRPLAGLAVIGWPVVLAALLALLRDMESASTGDDATADAPGWTSPVALGHPLLLLFAVAAVAWQTHAFVNELVGGDRVWGQVAWVIVPAAVLGLLGALCDRIGWPFGRWPRFYLLGAGVPLAVVSLTWMAWANVVSRGDPAPLPFAPLLNPLDLAQIGVVLALVFCAEALAGRGIVDLRGDHPRWFWGALAVIGFVFVNGVLLRAMHHWGGIPWYLGAMLASKTVQAAFSILWTACALVGMLVARRTSTRSPWLAGAALLGVVVAKLLLVDLSGGVERIVSFIGVGVLMLVIGFFAPLPPRAKESS